MSSVRPSSPASSMRFRGQAERERRAVDRERHIAQQEREPADVVLVAVRGDAAVDAVRVLAQVGEVRAARGRCPCMSASGNMRPQSRSMMRPSTSMQAAVAADLAESPEEDDADRISHGLVSPRLGSCTPDAGWRCTCRARSSVPAGAGPIGSRHWPTARPSTRSIALVGIGFGRVVAGLEGEALEQPGVRLAGPRSTSPFSNDEIISPWSTPDQCVATPITPTAPTASSGNVNESSPL